MSERMKTIRTLFGAVLAGAIILFAQAAAPAAEKAVLSPDDSAAVRRAVRYLNNITTFKARFIQVSSNGTYAEGEVIVKRPGKLRIDYDPPHPVLMIANGLTFLFYDRELKQASFLPLWETPLWFLIREEIVFSEKIRVIKVEQDRATLRIVLVDDGLPDAGEITLVFSDKPLVLKKWEIVDAQGTITQVSLVNPNFGVKIDPKTFDYRDLEIHTGRSREHER